MSVQWLAQGRPPPTAEQWRSLIETKVREEVLFREALALGLDKDDTIVKRRMAQKMDFLGEDLSRLVEPKPDELRAWFEKNTTQFALPPRVSFRHVYFSPDRRGQNARADASRALVQIAGKAQDSPAVAASGDPFMFQDYYGDRSSDQVAAQFGPKFAQVLFDQKPGAWQGPIESGYGWHLVFIDSITPERVPPFEEIEQDVKAQWIAEQREETKRRMYDSMRARYEVVLPKAKAASSAPPAPRQAP
jgi:parvulin-like peptidyl-prolyl isomerase